MHILSNATVDRFTSAANVDPILSGMRGLTWFLHDKLTRNLFVATCCIGQHQPLRALFRTFPETLVDWRWEGVWRVVQKLLDIQVPLRACWQRDRIATGGGRVHPDGHHDHAGATVGIGAHLEQANWAVRSSYFWGYIQMLGVLGELIEHMFHWFESCPCHSDLQFGRATSWAAAQAAFRRFFGAHPELHGCPLKGRRAPELAGGGFDVLLNELMGLATAHILVILPLGLSIQERNRILQDFDHMKNTLVFTLQTKFSVWRQLPRILFGLGHWDVGIARHCATRALRALISIEHLS
jgi:hypothetical protein